MDVCPHSLSENEEMETGTCWITAERSLGNESKRSGGVMPGAGRPEQKSALLVEVADLYLFCEN